MEDRFVEVLRSSGSVRDVHHVKARRLTPEVFKLKAELVLDEGFLVERLVAVLPRECGVVGESGRERVLRALAREAVDGVRADLARSRTRCAVQSQPRATMTSKRTDPVHARAQTGPLKPRR
ncbi:MAG: hypothetical protein L0Y66_11560 [Myxococcaceae bacterium]|nr:hypothetical protein [Myxococcaceae bacterium]